FGPSKWAARLEGSKGFTKDLCKANAIPTAAYRRFKNASEAKQYVRTRGAPIVVKDDGLAAGKRVGDGDTGPNTGGMGAYSPAPIMTADMNARVMREIVEPTVRAMKAMGAP